MLDSEGIVEALRTLGDVLDSRNLRFEIIAVGGSALLLVGIGSRPTKDLDIVAVGSSRGYVRADPLPKELVRAARDVASNLGLIDNWLNSGPASLMDFGLPEGFFDRIETRQFGGLVVHLAGRLDQICFKLYATVDLGLESKHRDDLDRLYANEEELLIAGRWSTTHDPSPAFKAQLVAVLTELGVKNAATRI